MRPSANKYLGRGARLISVLAAGVLAGCGGGSLASAPSPVPVAAQPTPAPTPTPLPIFRTAVLRGVNGHAAGGTARVARAGSGYQLELDQDFFSNGTVRVDVYLTREAEVLGSSDLLLGQLVSRSGAQTFDMGDNDGTKFGHVMLWCRPFQITIGSGELR